MVYQNPPAYIESLKDPNFISLATGFRDVTVGTAQIEFDRQHRQVEAANLCYGDSSKERSSEVHASMERYSPASPASLARINLGLIASEDC